ncbi:transcription elongation factor, mitochondrial [Anabrus simplex]|uniref:transcription elongation factor, mitochondrial n=1 Tax=Anabrus simplex TaxID=316456 RepID=UPI0035A353BA
MRILKHVVSQRRKCAFIIRPLHDSAGYMYEPRYSSEQQKKILQILNDSSRGNLAEFAISKTRIERLQKFLEKNGPFRDLNEVLEVEGLSVKTLERLCDSIISDKEQVKDGSKKVVGRLSRSGLVIPSAKFINGNVVKNVVGLHVNRSVISWANLSRDRELLHWDMYELPSGIKNHPCHLYEVLVDVKKKLPQADLYVMEDVRYSLQHLSDLLFHHIRTILFMLLNNDQNVSCSSEISHRVFFLRHLASARLFERLVGNEKVSAQSVVSKILETTFQNSVSADCSLRITYSAKNSVEKELLSEALLLTVSFMDLIVLKNIKELS